MKHANTLSAALAAFVAVSSASVAAASQVKLDVSMATPTLLAGKKQIAYLKVGLTGFDMEAANTRTPVNVALVIDKSGSMSGDKIKKAREAAIMAVESLSEEDIISIIAYSDSASVLVPATKVSDRSTIRDGINKLEANGSTALFAGVSKGAAEVRKFLDKNRVNRVILISDGQANIGPDSAGELGDLGASLAKEGISVSTIGLGTGYNEDLMSKLASRSDGNHAFAENSDDMASIFKYEFGDLTSVVAQEIEIHIRCARGVRPVKVIGRTADISGLDVNLTLNQLYSKQEKYMILEVEVPEGEAGAALDVASVDVRYANMETRTGDKLRSTVGVRFSESRDEVEQLVDKETMADAILQTTTEVNKKARDLRNEGDIKGAEEILQQNVVVLKDAASTYKSSKLKVYAEQTSRTVTNLSEGSWSRESKQMVEDMDVNINQRSW